MKILYAIQGTGNGHVCRAHDIVPILSRKADVDVLISGIQSDLQLPFHVKYIFKGLSFVFGKKGGVDLLATYRKGHLKQLLREIHSLPVEEYDLVISDFEPVSSWACKVKNKPCIALSHQAAVLNKKSPQPNVSDAIGKAILRSYAPSSVQYAFHFDAYDGNIFTPVIRKEVRDAVITNDGHYTVYLPAYSDKRIIKVLSACNGTEWHVFSKHFEHAVDVPGIKLLPLNSADFISSMASSAGVLCGAGFEAPAEALYLGKKLLVIPMKNQYEQHCNAAALAKMGVPVLKSLKPKYLQLLNNWLSDGTIISVNYTDQTEQIIDQILQLHYAPEIRDQSTYDNSAGEVSVKKFRKMTLNKILHKLSG